MYVVSRKKDESVVIDNRITVTVVEIRFDKVRLGFVVPKEMSVHRQEVLDAKHGIEKEPNEKVKTPDFLLEESWPQEFRDEYPAAAKLTERRANFLGKLASRLQEKSERSVSLSEVAQTLIDGVQEMGIDLSQASSLEQLKQLVRDSGRGHR